MALRFLNSGYFAGKVGIGTDDPLYQLQVQDRIHIEDITNSQPKISFSENTNATGEFVLEYNGAGGGAGNYVSFYSEVGGWVSKGNGLNYIPQNGYVGIGTTSPSAKLHLEGDAIIEGVLRADNVNLGLGGAIKLKASNTATDQYVAFGTTPSGSSGSATFTEKMRIASSGNVGIGTPTPTTPLHFGKSVYQLTNRQVVKPQKNIRI